MHQFGKRSFFSTNSTLSPLAKKRRNQKLVQQQQYQSLQRKEEELKSSNDSILGRIKKRTFSLSKFQSVQQSDIAQQISFMKKADLQTVKTLGDKVVFQKLNLNVVQIQNQASKSHRKRSQKNPFFQSEGSAEQELSLLKMILKKKEEDLIMSKQKQAIQEKKLKFSEDQNRLQSQSGNAIKRIKLLKKTQEYEFYDNIVHNLLNNISKGSQQKDRMFKKDPVKIRLNPNQTQQTNQLDGRKQLKSTSLSNIKAVLEKQKLGKTSSTNFSSTLNISLTRNKRQNMVFGLSNMTSDSIYQKKITTFIEFLYKINFSNSIYVDLSLSGHISKSEQKKSFKVFIGPGNNSELIKSVVKRRFWLQLTTNKAQANFVWTQDTQKNIHTKQLQQLNQVNDQNSLDTQIKKPLYSLKNKFTKTSYSQKSNRKVLHEKEIQESDAAFSRSYMGLKSPHPEVMLKIITNHIPNNSIIGSKKILFKLMHWYYSEMQNIDPFTYLPYTYHIVPGDKDNIGIKKFKQQQLEKKERIWIIKPGQNTNRGNGISVASTIEIERLMRYKKFHKNGEPQTFIVQKYLKPFLYNNRKFDIRHYLLITSVNGFIKGYWYKAGYIRTSSEKFDLEEIDNEFIHLTNDAIQKNSQNYGKYEEGNKLSYTTFQRYLDNSIPHKKYDFEKQILEEMKKITTDVLRAGFMFLDPNRNERLGKGKGSNFQLYGMDFMIDHMFKPYLIEINANPCLEISCPLLQRLIPIAIEHTFRLALDPLMPPNDHYTPSKRYQLSDRILDRLKFELIFDQKYEGKELRQKYKLCQNKFQLNGVPLEPQEDLFEDDGQEIKDDQIFDEVN